MSDFYWELVQHDGTRLEVPPTHVDEIKKRMDSGSIIHTNSMSIPINQIKYLRQTERLYNPRPMLEAAAQAFKEPLYAENGSIKARWVKKDVPQRVYNKKYDAIPAYRKLGSGSGMVTVAFKLPIHQIDHNILQECTDEEVKSLTSR